MYAGTAKDKIKAHLKKLTPGKLQKDTKYAAVTPKTKVKNKTPIKIEIELLIYCKRNVSFRSDKQSLVVSKKLKKIVIIGIATSKGTSKEVIYQIFILLFNSPPKIQSPEEARD